jgi:hypothetical protein
MFFHYFRHLLREGIPLYLAQKTIRGRPHYFIRQSYRKDDAFLSRDLFDLGTNPTKYIVYPGGNAFYIDEIVTNHLDAKGVQVNDAQLEDIFWQFLRPDIQQVLEPFRRREKISKASQGAKEEDNIIALHHLFDKRRIYFLRFGRMDQRNLGRLPARLFRMLDHKSRDEIEQQFIEMETVLKPSEYKAYTYTIFNLQHFFTEWFAKETPQMLDQQKADEYFLDQICVLNQDKVFWFGTDTGDRLHDYLTRYLVMYFDYEYTPRSFVEEYIRNFINNRRDYRSPFPTGSAFLDEASSIFGESKAALKEMNRRNLARLYRRRAQRFHPDKGGDHEKFVKLTRAYHALLKTKK